MLSISFASCVHCWSLQLAFFFFDFSLFLSHEESSILRDGVFERRWFDVSHSSEWTLHRVSSEILWRRNCIWIEIFTQERNHLSVCMMKQKQQQKQHKKKTMDCMSPVTLPSTNCVLEQALSNRISYRIVNVLNWTNEYARITKRIDGEWHGVRQESKRATSKQTREEETKNVDCETKPTQSFVPMD